MAVAKPRQSTTAAPTAAPANQAIHLADYSPHPRNYNRHSTEQIQKIAASLTAFGQVRSIVVWRKWFLAGHGVALAAASLGWTELRADVLPDSFEESRALSYLAADNELARQSDPDLAQLAAILQESAATDGDLLLAMGYSDAEYEALLAEVGQGVAAGAGDAGEGDEAQIEDFPVADLLAPYPYFGGKRAIAGAVWARFGEVENYVEPFFGSGAMLLSRPAVIGLETVNDLDGFIANFWRAAACDPAGVAHHVDWPTSETDLFSRHLWLVQQRGVLTERLHADPEFFDAKIVGWWCWGACNWIGTGWCTGDGPWQVNGETVRKLTGSGGVRSKLPHVGDAGRGVNRQLPHVGDAGRGVNRQLPHVGNAGRGVNRQLPHVGNAGQGVNRKLPELYSNRGINRATPTASSRHAPTAATNTNGQCAEWSAHLAAMMQRLSDRLRRVRVACGDWSRVCTSSVTDRHGLSSIFLDPPYAQGAMEYSAGGNGDSGLTNEVRAWCVENGDNPQLRLAFCGYEPLAMPRGWTALRWTAPKGYQNAANAENRRREIIWFSPHCLAVNHA